MGVVFDSTVLIAGERAGLNPRLVVGDILSRIGDAEAILSVITVLELAHGIERSNSQERRRKRERFLDELLREIFVEPITTAVAMRAGLLNGKLQASGVQIALGDLLIGSTALELDFEVITHNVRHFEMIPGLTVRQV